MDRKILIAYATWTGATKEVAQKIANVLQEGGIETELKAAKEVNNLGGYEAVVLGSAARIGKLNSEAYSFFQKHQESLKQKRFAAFVVCLTMKEDTPENRRTVTGYLEAAMKNAPGLQPVSTGLFAGILDIQRLKQPWKFFMSRGNFPQGDFRDWDAIRAWASSLHSLLLPE